MTPPLPRRPRLTPALQQLEARDVPATFYVDPLFTGGAGTTATFNEFGPNAVPGVTIGTNAFATLTDALTEAAANTEADTIFLARSRYVFGGGAATATNLVPNVTPVDNTGGPILIDDDITLIGSGRGATILAPTTDTAAFNTGVFEVQPGRSLAVQDLSFDASGRQVGIGFRFDGVGTTGTFTRVEITAVAFAPIDGTGVLAASASKVDVTDSQISGYGRVGVRYQDATGTVLNSTITGKGAGTTFVNYGIQMDGASAVVITGNTISGNAASTPDPFLSAGVDMAEFGGAAPTATLTKNTITGNTFGVHVGADFGNDRSEASIRNNNLNGNYLAIQADNKVAVDAVNNWYGDASGPFQITTNPMGTGSEVTDQVNFTPFLTAPFVDTVTVPGPVVTVPVPVPGPVQIVEVPGPVQIVTVPVPVPAPAVTPPPSGLAVGGSGQVTGLDGTLASVLSRRPFGAGFAGEVRVARADVTGDGVADFITAAGAGGGPRVLVFDGKTGGIVRDFMAYPEQFTGGVFVAGGDIDGDGFADIVTGAGGGGGTNVRAFSGKDGTLIRSFFVYDPRYIGGVTVAVGDVTGDGFADIVTGTTAGGGPNVRVFDGQTNQLVRSFFAYDQGFTGGVFVAAGDLDGNGFAEIVTGTGAGGGPNVRAFDGQTNALRNSFLVGEAGYTGGVRVGAQDLDNDGRADLLFGFGSGGGNRAQVTYASNLAKGNFNPTAFSQPLFGTQDGIYVG